MTVLSGDQKSVWLLPKFQKRGSVLSNVDLSERATPFVVSNQSCVWRRKPVMRTDHAPKPRNEGLLQHHRNPAALAGRGKAGAVFHDGPAV